MNIINFRNMVVGQLYNHIKVPVISIPSVNPLPSYPFVTYSIINAYLKDDNGYKITVDDIPTYVTERKVQQLRFIISFNVYGEDSFQIKQLAKDCKDYFDFIGKIALKQEGIIIVESTDIDNRDLLNVDEYERREGFDVTFRLVDIVDRHTETIDTYSITEK